MTEAIKNSGQRWGIWVAIVGILAVGLFLRVYRLTDDLPYVDLGASGVFLLDEGFYQVSAAHKAMFGQWQMPGTVYGGWTVRAYQLWILLFFKLFGVTLFAARLACASAFMLSLTVMLGVLRKYVAPRVVLIFGVLSATNYLLVMWPRMALPYAVALLPASGVLLFTLLAIFRKSSLSAAVAAIFALLCGTVKETAILFFPIGLISCVLGLWLYHGMTLWRAVLNRVVAAYIITFAVAFGAYQVFFLAPVSHEWWNDSAQQAREVVQDAAKIVTQPVLKSSSHQYGAWVALEKLCLKFLGMKHVGWIWGLALIGILFVAKSYKKSITGFKKNTHSIVTLFMLVWALVMVCGIVVTRFRSGLAVHWSPLYLTPVVYFAALGFHKLWTCFNNRWLILARTMALTLLIGAIGYDLMQYQNWIQQLPENSQINKVAGQIANDVLKEESRPTLLMFDSPIVFLRHPQVNTLSMREFHVEKFSDAYQIWTPQFVVLTNPILRPQVFQNVVDSIRHQGFELQARGNYPLGKFDGSEVELKLYRLKKST